MKKLIIAIERSKDLFSAYAVNAEGVYGAGETVSEAVQSFWIVHMNSKRIFVFSEIWIFMLN